MDTDSQYQTVEVLSPASDPTYTPTPTTTNSKEQLHPQPPAYSNPLTLPSLSLQPVPTLSHISHLLHSTASSLSLVSHNKAALRRLVTRAHALLSSVNHFLSTRLSSSSSPDSDTSVLDKVPDAVQRALDTLLELVKVLDAFVRKQGTTKFMNSFVNREGISAKITQYNHELSMIAQDLTVAIQIENDSWAREDSEDRKFDAEQLEMTLQHLVDNDYKILNALELKQVEYLEACEALQKNIAEHIDRSLEKNLERIFLERALTCLRRASEATHPTLSAKPTPPPPWVLTSWEIEIHDPISRGGFGEVLKATWLGHTLVAVKRLHMRLETQRLRDDFMREVKTWFPLRHPNILPLLGACASAERPFMVSPFMARGHALQYLEGVGRRDVEVKGCKVLYEVSLGMQYLHARGVVHGDLKAVNVLVDEHGTAYVADFGFATLKQFSSTRTGTGAGSPAFGGTLRWMSPERLQGAKLSPPVDVYAFSMTAYEILSEGDVPFTETPDALLYQQVVNNGLRPSMPNCEAFPTVSTHLWRLMGNCWSPDPLGRPSFSGVSVSMKTILREATAGAQKSLSEGTSQAMKRTEAVSSGETGGDSGVTSISGETGAASYSDFFRGPVQNQGAIVRTEVKAAAEQAALEAAKAAFNAGARYNRVQVAAFAAAQAAAEAALSGTVESEMPSKDSGAAFNQERAEIVGANVVETAYLAAQKAADTVALVTPTAARDVPLPVKTGSVPPLPPAMPPMPPAPFAPIQERPAFYHHHFHRGGGRGPRRGRSGGYDRRRRESKDTEEEEECSSDSVSSASSARSERKPSTKKELQKGVILLQSSSESTKRASTEEVEELQFEPGTWGAFVYNMLPILPKEMKNDIKSKMHEFAVQLHQEDVKLEGEGVFIDFIQDIKKAGAKAKPPPPDWKPSPPKTEGIRIELTSEKGKIQEDLEEAAKDIQNAVKEVEKTFGFKFSVGAKKPKQEGAEDEARSRLMEVDDNTEDQLEKFRLQEEAVRAKQAEVQSMEKLLHQQRQIYERQRQLQEQKIRLKEQEIDLAAMEEELMGAKSTASTPDVRAKLQEEIETLHRLEEVYRENERRVRDQKNELKNQLKEQEKLSREYSRVLADRQREAARQQKDAINQRKETARQQKELLKQRRELSKHRKEIEKEVVSKKKSEAANLKAEQGPNQQAGFFEGMLGWLGGGRQSGSGSSASRSSTSDSRLQVIDDKAPPVPAKELPVIPSNPVDTMSGSTVVPSVTMSPSSLPSSANSDPTKPFKIRFF